MSAAPPHPTPPSPLGRPSTSTNSSDEIVIVSHSNLFYWWPVWAVGFLLFLLTYADGYRLAIVPQGTKGIEVPVKIGGEDRYVLAFPASFDPSKQKGLLGEPTLHATTHKGYAVLWATVLILVIVVTNVPLRGMWSFVVIMVVVFLSIIFTAWELWEPIFRYLSALDIRMNAGGYAFISFFLFLVWILTFAFFDRQIYMIFTPGQLKVCTEIGGGEQVYDAIGMTLQKQRSDLFRHWILGLGSGDLVVKTSGAQAHHFDLPNVLFITRKVQQIEDMLKKRAVVESR